MSDEFFKGAKHASKEKHLVTTGISFATEERNRNIKRLKMKPSPRQPLRA
jgi:hypothetical protein